MTLDIAMVDADERPIDTVDLGVEDHHQLMMLAIERNFTQLSKFADYYGEATIRADELPALATEVEALLSTERLPPSLADTVRRLLTMTRRAIEECRVVLAIPD